VISLVVVVGFTFHHLKSVRISVEDATAIHFFALPVDSHVETWHVFNAFEVDIELNLLRKRIRRPRQSQLDRSHLIRIHSTIIRNDHHLEERASENVDAAHCMVVRKGLIDSALEDVKPSIVFIVIFFVVIVQIVPKIEGNMLLPQAPRVQELHSSRTD